MQNRLNLDQNDGENLDEILASNSPSLVENGAADLYSSPSPSEQERYEQLQRMALDFARYGDTGELEKMIVHGLSPNLQDNKGNTLLMLAAYNNQPEVVKMLLKRGAAVDLKNDRGQTPLAGVCFKGYLNIVKILVENGANIHENNGLGATPLTFAALFGHKDIVEYLNSFGDFKKGAFRYKLISKFVALFRKRG